MKRRGNGEGTVQKLSAHNYKAIAVIGWKDSTHPIKRTKSGFRTATEARAYIAELKQKRTCKRCFADYWSIYSNGEMLNVSEGTQRKYNLAYSRIASISTRDLHDLHLDDLNGLVADLTANSAKSLRNLLSNLYQLAMAEEYVASNLALLMTLPTEHGELKRSPFTEDEIDLLWSAWERKHERVLGSVLLLIYTGMMPIELLGLRTEHVHGSTIIGVGAKTEKRRASPILVPDIVMPVLCWLCKHAEDGRVMPMIDKRYREQFKATLGVVGISNEHTPYDCRHTTATLYAQFLDPNTLTEVMRHTTLQMTQHYKHNRADEMLAKLNDGLRKEGG